MDRLSPVTTTYLFGISVSIMIFESLKLAFLPTLLTTGNSNKTTTRRAMTNLTAILLLPQLPTHCLLSGHVLSILLW